MSETPAAPEALRDWARMLDAGCAPKVVSALLRRAALASPTEPAPDAARLNGEYGRLLAWRDRLIAEGVDPSELDMPDRKE